MSMSMSIGGISPYASYDYLPPQPPEISGVSDAADSGMDFGMDGVTPAELAQVAPVQTREQDFSIQSAEGARGSDKDGLRRDHSTSKQDLMEIQAVMMSFSTRRMMELQNTGSI
ncbi:MAG: hypothetical protein J6N76_04135 [Lachnospiraceae bacterium]|nr:hypothetical protein [Lachnospiraceae bacterium]